MSQTEVFPGDSVPAARRFGPGVADGRALVAGRALERHGTVFVDANLRRYTPAVRDVVVGVVSQRSAEAYKVLLQPHSKPVRLGQMAFENATKKNKPNLEPGDVVYARVTAAERNLEAEIECYDAKTGKAAGFGPLKEGTIVAVRLGFARELLLKGHPALDRLGGRFAFELAVGLNGRVWVKGPNSQATLAIVRELEAADEAFAQ